jgi:hypothetical protein
MAVRTVRDFVLPPCMQHGVLTRDPVIQVLDRCKSPGRVPKELPVDDLPAKHLVLRRDGTQEWVAKTHLSELEQWKVIQFEMKYPQSPAFPCESVVRYDFPELSVIDLSGDIFT